MSKQPKEMWERDRTFTISVEGTCPLTVDEIWPLGDAPEEPTIQDVIAAIRECGSSARLISEWNLPCSVSVEGEIALDEM